MPTREENKNFKIYRIDFENKLKEKIKGTSWKKKHNSIFTEIKGHFFCANFYPRINGSVRIRIETKPMVIDPLFWEIFDLKKNKTKPLSFRAWGAFKCPNVIFFEESISENKTSKINFINQLFDVIDIQINLMLSKCDAHHFSNIIKSNELQKISGTYGITLIMCLICEGKLIEAKNLAEDYESKRSKCNHTFSHSEGIHAGKSFNKLAIEWIDTKL